MSGPTPAGDAPKIYTPIQLPETEVTPPSQSDSQTIQKKAAAVGGPVLESVIRERELPSSTREPIQAKVGAFQGDEGQSSRLEAAVTPTLNKPDSTANIPVSAHSNESSVRHSFSDSNVHAFVPTDIKEKSLSQAEPKSEFKPHLATTLAMAIDEEESSSETLRDLGIPEKKSSWLKEIFGYERWKINVQDKNNENKIVEKIVDPKHIRQLLGYKETYTDRIKCYFRFSIFSEGLKGLKKILATAKDELLPFTPPTLNGIFGDAQQPVSLQSETTSVVLPKSPEEIIIERTREKWQTKVDNANKFAKDLNKIPYNDDAKPYIDLLNKAEEAGCTAHQLVDRMNSYDAINIKEAIDKAKKNGVVFNQYVTDVYSFAVQWGYKDDNNEWVPFDWNSEFQQIYEAEKKVLLTPTSIETVKNASVSVDNVQAASVKKTEAETVKEFKKLCRSALIYTAIDCIGKATFKVDDKFIAACLEGLDKNVIAALESHLAREQNRRGFNDNQTTLLNYFAIKT